MAIKIPRPSDAPGQIQRTRDAFDFVFGQPYVNAVLDAFGISGAREQRPEQYQSACLAVMRLIHERDEEHAAMDDD